MTDMEKVIRGLKCHYNCNCEVDAVTKKMCPYFEYDDCSQRLISDTLASLKEQEETIERLEHDLSITQGMLDYYINGND